MKKIVVLCMAACGLMAAAQAQVVADNGAQRVNRSETQVTKTEAMAPLFTAPRVKAGTAVYDTLHWKEEYLKENTDCQNYSYYLRWQDGGYFEHEVMIHAYGSNMNGSGEIGASFRTKNDAYLDYNGWDLNAYAVVGAVAIVYRQGSFGGWERVGVDFTNNHYEEINGVKVPLMPYKVKGYPVVRDQDAVEYYAVDAGKELNIVSVLMPLTKKDAPTSDVNYMPFSEIVTNSGGVQLPRMRFVGGMFDKAFLANNDYGVSFEVQLTNDKTYDSLWNWGIGVKSGEDCAFLETRLSWERIDYSHPDGWNMYRNKNGGVLNVADTSAGFILEGCPQYDNDSSLFVPTCSQYFMTTKKFLPAIYGILQDKNEVDNLWTPAANENRDTYAMTVSAYPVPAADIVNLVSLDPMKRVEIYNLAGMLVKHVTLNVNVIEIDVTDLPAGSYIAKVITDKGVASKKLVVK